MSLKSIFPKTGINLPKPPANTLLLTSTQRLHSQILSGGASHSMGTQNASPGSGTIPTSTTLSKDNPSPDHTLANEDFDFPMIETSAKNTASQLPAPSGRLQNDILISIAELSGKLINTQQSRSQHQSIVKNTTATQIKLSRDLTANPCEDFYQYTCGGWLDRSRIRPDLDSRSVKWELMERVDHKLHRLLSQSVKVQHTLAEQKAITFYKSCINEGSMEKLGLAVIKPLIKDVGGWPILDTNWTDSNYKLEKMLSAVRKYTIDTPIFSMSVESDPHFPEQHIIHVEQPDLGMPDRMYYLADNQLFRAYFTYMLEVFKALGANPATVVQDVKDVLEFETQLANLTEEIDEHNEHANDRRMTIDQLTQAFPGMLPDSKSTTIPSRWQQCVDITNEAFSLAVARLFVDKHFDAASKLEVMDMFTKTKMSMRSMLQRESWMDQATKTAALDKLDSLQARIGYPDEIRDDSFLTKRYSRCRVTPGLFFENILNVMKDEAASNLRDLTTPSNVLDWESPPAAKDVFYDLDQNVIVLPAGILQSPYFHKNYPRYLNYGAIGFIIGHKIIHAFDDVGSKYSKTGAFQDWWSNYTRTAYEQKANCFIKQYHGRTVPDALTASTLPKESKLNGKLTLLGNIADNGGLTESFLAYTQWSRQNGFEQKLPGINLDPDQLFFINYGRTRCEKTTTEEAKKRIKNDAFADAKSRVNVVMQNNPSFAKAFSCPVGSPMNPAKKCAVW
ncbi:neprilysin-1-like [Ylistrum balloti]|uniref:neprilysin-1-like n=1 Tax=Ylistrum balloti TaxID=509963 RepID=UPI0029057E6D|nr:neprilysin-1-like [Ylistrum balloti]